MQQEMQEHQRRAARIEQLIEEVAAFPDAHARATTEELLQALLDMYGEGLARILELAEQTEGPDHALTTAFHNDELVGALFLVHGLHPIDMETRILGALDEVRPYLKSHSGNVELLRVEDGVAYLRLQGSCHGCPSSSMTLKLAIEEAIYKAAPDLDGLEVEGVTQLARPITFIPRPRPEEHSGAAEQDGGWNAVAGLGSFARGALKVLHVQGAALLFCQIEGAYYAYHDQCNQCHASLASGKLEGTILRCSACGQQYDLCRAGRCLEAPDLFLEPVPLLVEGGKVKVALSALATGYHTSAGGAGATM